ncbi:hypothetical protein CDD83_9151 [Cordyceps sp. RAO-2017]|nr:hypothetical protein CDD83_9151 [Cordyceps sp. RAO-2017]
MREHVAGGRVPRCADAGCGGLVKPDIVFFGEPLPPAFSQNAHQAAMADLLLVIGTSLTVYPFAGLPDSARDGAPRVLFNMERVGRIGARPDDVIRLGECDAGIRALADALGWRDELEQLWRDLVGDDEVQRQAQRRSAPDESEDEVVRMAQGLAAVLKLDEEEEEE